MACESGTVSAAPALGNAIFAATGIRLRDLPFRKDDLRVARKSDEALVTAVLAVVAILVVAALAFFFWPTGFDDIDETDTAKISEEELLAHGARVAREGDCIACHTVEDGDPHAGGLPFPLPFGTIYAPNITPHPEAGIGDWSL